MYRILELMTRYDIDTYLTRDTKPNNQNPIPWASYQIRKIAGCACAGNAGNVFPRRRFQRKPVVSDPGMYHGTCVTHVPWCMSGSLTCGDGESVPGIPGACAPAISRIWQEAHAVDPLQLGVEHMLGHLFDGQMPVWCQDIPWTSIGLEPLQTKCRDIGIEIQNAHPRKRL